MKRFCFLALILSVIGLNAFGQANNALSNLTNPTSVNQSLIPSIDNTLNLGSSSVAWKSAYFKGNIFFDGKRFISNTGGNTFIGTQSGKSNNNGSYNTACGDQTLYSNTDGYSNIAFGFMALYANTTGALNTALGIDALYNNTTAFFNTGIGFSSLYSNTTGAENTGEGYLTLYANTTGNLSTATGENALASNTTGSSNTANGSFSLVNCITGSYNTAIGQDALSYNLGSYNTAVGYAALDSTTSSQYNTAVNYDAGNSYDNGYNNLFLGANTDVNGAGYYNDIAIGQGTLCTGVNQARIGNSATVSIGGYANWTNISDGRVKKNIKQNVPGLAFINKLQPITYNLDLDAADRIVQPAAMKDSEGNVIAPSQQELDARKAKEQIVYTGFIAQDVEKQPKA